MKKTPLKKSYKKTKHTSDKFGSMLDFFTSIWDKQFKERGIVTCFETNKELYLNNRKNAACYHHILEKNLYPEYAFEEWNVVIVRPEVHFQVHANIDFTPKIKKKTEELKIKVLDL